MESNKILEELALQLVETGSAKIDIDAIALLDEKTYEKIRELKQKIQMYLGNSPEMVLERYKIVSEVFPELKEKLMESNIVKYAILANNLNIKIYASGEFVIRTSDGKFSYKRKLKDISKFIQSLKEAEENKNKKISLLFTYEELVHLFATTDMFLDGFDVKKINILIANLVMDKVKKKEILPFKKEEDEIAFHYFVLSLRSKLSEKQVYLWEHRNIVFNELGEEPEFTIFYDRETKLLLIPTKFIRFVIERNPRMLLSVFAYLGIKDITKIRTSFSSGDIFESKIDVYYYAIPVAKLNSILQKLGYKPLEIEYIDETELRKKIEEKRQTIESSLEEYKENEQ